MAVASAARDVAILIARIGVGVVFIAHGWQKLVTFGVAGSAAGVGHARRLSVRPRRHGLFVTKGGGELAIGLGAASLLLAAVGAGRLSLDRLISTRRRRRTAPAAG